MHSAPRARPACLRMRLQLRPAGDSLVTMGTPHPLSTAVFPQRDPGLRCSPAILPTAIGAPVMQWACVMCQKGARSRFQEGSVNLPSCVTLGPPTNPSDSVVCICKGMQVEPTSRLTVWMMGVHGKGGSFLPSGSTSQVLWGLGSVSAAETQNTFPRCSAYHTSSTLRFSPPGFLEAHLCG